MAPAQNDPGATREIGPYRFEQRLGTGGMGEVYRAYDRRLDRSVAVKLVRSDHAEDPRARERLRREARAAAGLSHPAIVQIFDILEQGEEEAIVMELVEGELLSRRLVRGPLDIGIALRFGQEIAEGLAAAHGRGILHRDLKAENVMISQDGHVKILDFGLAWKIAGEIRLTQTDMVVGTYRCMAPEQAQGLPVDARTDLFALGVLLYEMLTGQSPFEGATASETLSRVCAQRQRPAQEIRPEIPDPLSRLVDDLLEKDPLLRPQGARQVALELSRLTGASTLSAQEESTRFDLPPAAVARQETVSAPTAGAPSPLLRRRLWRIALAGLLLATGVLAWRLLRHPPAPVYVVAPVPQVVQGAGLPGVNALASGLHSAILMQLAAFETVLPLETEREETAASPRDLARATGADEVVSSRLRCETTVCQVSLSRIRGRDGALLWSRSFSAPVEQPYLLPEAVLAHLKNAYPEHALRDRRADLGAGTEDYAEYLRLYEEFDLRRGESLSTDEILARLSTLHRRSPRFLEPLILQGYILQQRYRYGRRPEDLQNLFEVARQARLLAPDDPRPLISLFEAAMLANQLDRAEEALRQMERLQPGDARMLALRARLLDRQGQSQRALALMQSAVQRMPSWHHLFWLADMEYRLGKVQDARAHLHTLLDRSPGNYMGESLLGQLELYNGVPQRAEEIYGRLARRSPQYGELGNLGLAQFLLGHFGEAEKSYRQAVALQPRNPLAILNLADACLLSGREREARSLYTQVLQLAEQDPSAGSDWQLSSVRAQSLAHLGRKDEAIAAVQKALQLAPDNPQAAYEASLVYVLLGDGNSARFNARRALEQGVGPRWFSFPWFAPLREDPELRDLLRPRSQTL